MAWISTPGDLTLMWLVVDFQTRTAAYRLLSNPSCEEVPEVEALFAEGAGRPASGSRRKRRWNVCGSI